MKILYGVQGTGNGHITRARVMNQQLQAAGAEVDYVFSGRSPDKYFDMEGFGNWHCFDGLTFAVERGRVKPLSTARNAKPLQFLKDLRSLPVRNYDLVISDFEPVSAWAAKQGNVPCLGIGHQYAFRYAIPKQGDNALTRIIMREFAPATFSLGLHWYHFQQPIAPPMVEKFRSNEETNAGTILVYLPFEDPQAICTLLNRFPDFRFVYYGGFAQELVRENVSFFPPSRDGFQNHLAASGGVISNAGFELASEAIGFGKKLLVKPLHGQMEQLSNALALQTLRLGQSTAQFNHAVLQDWLDNVSGKQIRYPNVAERVVRWIQKGDLSDKNELLDELWAKTESFGLNTFSPFENRPAAKARPKALASSR